MALSTSPGPLTEATADRTGTGQPLPTRSQYISTSPAVTLSGIAGSATSSGVMTRRPLATV